MIYRMCMCSHKKYCTINGYDRLAINTHRVRYFGTECATRDTRLYIRSVEVTNTGTYPKVPSSLTSALQPYSQYSLLSSFEQAEACRKPQPRPQRRMVRSHSPVVLLDRRSHRHLIHHTRRKLGREDIKAAGGEHLGS